MISHRLGLINKNQRGFTLVGLILAIAVTGIISGGITMTISQVFDHNARSTAHMTAVKQVEHAVHWISRDAQMAQTVMDSDDPATADVTEFFVLSWTEWSNDVHRVAYILEDDELKRSHYVNPGEPSETLVETVVARYIDPDGTSCTWDDVEGELTFTLTAAVGYGSKEAIETRAWEVGPRSS